MLRNLAPYADYKLFFDRKRFTISWSHIESSAFYRKKNFINFLMLCEYTKSAEDRGTKKNSDNFGSIQCYVVFFNLSCGAGICNTPSGRVYTSIRMWPTCVLNDVIPSVCVWSIPCLVLYYGYTEAIASWMMMNAEYVWLLQSTRVRNINIIHFFFSQKLPMAKVFLSKTALVPLEIILTQKSTPEKFFFWWWISRWKKILAEFLFLNDVNNS